MGKSCMTNQTASWDKLSVLVAEGGMVDIICFDFWEVFDTVSQNFLLIQVGNQMDKHRWRAGSQRTAVKGPYSTYRMVMSGIDVCLGILDLPCSTTHPGVGHEVNTRRKLRWLLWDQELPSCHTDPGPASSSPPISGQNQVHQWR